MPANCQRCHLKILKPRFRVAFCVSCGADGTRAKILIAIYSALWQYAVADSVADFVADFNYICRNYASL